MQTLLSAIYKVGTRVKNWSYDYEILDQVRLPCPVVSVGNLSVGGTGKTPITAGLYDYLSRRFKRIVIVSRNYKALVRGVARIELDHPNAAVFYGDEPAWLAGHCPRSRVYVGERKYETAAVASAREQADLIIVDDGFQHRALSRDVDLVLWDATAENDKLLPLGRLREEFNNLDRANYVLLTKTNWARPELLEVWRERLQGRPVVEVKFAMNLSLDWVARTKGHAVAAFAGIAHPLRYKEQLEGQLQRELDAFWSFPDHFAYPPEALRQIELWLRQNPYSYVFTTEKDAIKLKTWIQSMARVVPVPLLIEWGQGSAAFFDYLDKTLRLHNNRH